MGKPEGSQSLNLGGHEITYGMCKNSSRKGYGFVNFDGQKSYVVDPPEATEKAIRDRGSDESKWNHIAKQIEFGFWNLLLSMVK